MFLCIFSKFTEHRNPNLVVPIEFDEISMFHVQSGFRPYMHINKRSTNVSEAWSKTAL